jgi:uncharacterized protein DUF5317
MSSKVGSAQGTLLPTTARGGSLPRHRLVARLKGWRWLLAGVAAYVILVQLLPQAAHLGWMILLIAWTVLNLRAPGVGLAALGAACNFAVVVANGGRMPYYGWAMSDAIHVPADGQTQLAFLADRLSVPGPWPYSMVSVGDALIVAGALWLAVALIAEAYETASSSRVRSRSSV